MCPYIVSVQLVVTVESTLVFSWKNRCLPCIGKGSSSLQSYQHSTNIIYSITNVHTSWTTGLQFYTCTTTTMVNMFRIKTVISLRPLSPFLSGQSLLRLLQPKTTLLIRPDFIYDVIQIYTHYIHSVVVQDFVSGRACCVNQYHYELLSRRVVMWYVHTTGKT